ncbi:exosortase C-terminal domain/associated protein EpsI [Kaarinaea lacus]
MFLLLLVILALYFSTSQSLYDLWIKSGNPAYSHGSIAFLIASYIFLKYWFTDSRAVREPKFHVLGFLALLLCSVLWFMAALGSVQILQQLLFIGLVAALFWSLFGVVVLKNLAIPLLIVLTAIPVWDFLNPYLQIATAIHVEAMLHVSDIPFVREGTNILLPNGTFQIEERCSGLRMFVAMVAIALLCIYQWRLRLGISIIFMVLSLALAIIINSIRIYIVVVAGYLTDMQHYFVTTDHVTLGWVLFGIVLFIYLMLCNKYLLSDRWYARITKPASDTAQNPPADRNSDNTINQPKLTFALVASLIGISIGPILVRAYQNHPDDPMGVKIELARQVNGWTVQERGKGDWQPVYNGTDYQDKKIYQNTTGDVVELYLAYYVFQAEGKEAIHHLNKLYNEEHWKNISRRKINKPLVSASLDINQLIIESTRGEKKLLWQWYYLNNRRVSGGAEAKLAGIRGILSGDPAITVLVAAADVNQNYDRTDAVLTSFLTESLDTIESAIDHASLVNNSSH